MKQLSFVLGLSLVMASCGKSLDEKAELVRKGMSKQEVTAILGQPEAIDWASKRLNDGMVKWFYGITSLRKPGRLKDGYYFMEGDADICVGFVGDRVVDIGPDLTSGDKFVKAEDLPKVRSKVDNFYERDLEKRIQ